MSDNTENKTLRPSDARLAYDLARAAAEVLRLAVEVDPCAQSHAGSFQSSGVGPPAAPEAGDAPSVGVGGDGSGAGVSNPPAPAAPPSGAGLVWQRWQEAKEALASARSDEEVARHAYFKSDEYRKALKAQRDQVLAQHALEMAR